MFANKEFEEDYMGKGLWLLKIFKKSKQKRYRMTSMSTLGLKTDSKRIQKVDIDIDYRLYN